MPLRAGRLSHRVTIQGRVETQTDSGEVQWVWDDLKTVYASIEPLTGKEYFAADGMQATVTTRIVMRFNPELHLDPTMRLKHVLAFGSPEIVEYFDIESIQHVNAAGVQLIIMARRQQRDSWEHG